ncbi:hypothetical protein DY000_02033149 [Brassica cretica]|uniref:Uncharacterized protein n=1 Tax=Brassica cretica TaxID=69181 RepID=A0ABQ7DGC1_BRACR|nr:hypothetical protein DY000_02033149 [Brassica cretica]
MKNMDFGQTSIDEEIGISIDRAKEISIDKSTGISVDDAHQTSIDNTPPEAGKYSLTNDANERVVLGKPKGQLSNANNQIIGEQGTEIPVQIKSISERDNEWKLPLQDYLNPGRTYSNSSSQSDDMSVFKHILHRPNMCASNSECKDDNCLSLFLKPRSSSSSDTSTIPNHIHCNVSLKFTIHLQICCKHKACVFCVWICEWASSEFCEFASIHA